MYPEEEEADSSISLEEKGDGIEILAQLLFNGGDSDENISAGADDTIEEKRDEFGSENIDSL
jgi:hypothetical protein